MDPSKTPLSPGGGKRRRMSPSSEPSIGSQGGQQSQTSLPSIRQLHPYLPPSSAMPHLMSIYESSPGYSNPSHYTSHLGPVASGSSQGMGAHSSRDPGMYTAGDSEADDLEHPGPPKKKRRRQALSCTECKRRKIKCDRSQPCTPCTRRGEQAGCQWHIVEPVEKYVTKAEFDELKGRFDQLTALVQRLLASAPGGTPYYAMAVPPTSLSGALAEAVPPYAGAGTSAPMSMGYGSMMAPPPQPPLPQQPSYPMEPPPQASSRYMKAELHQSPARQPHSGLPSTSPVMSSLHPSSSPSLMRGVHQVESSPLQSAAGLTAVKSSPLSLSSITSPYHPEHTSTGSQQIHHGHSKNSRAQTFILGERLRPGCEGPRNSGKILPHNNPAHRGRRRVSNSRRRNRCMSIRAQDNHRPIRLRLPIKSNTQIQHSEVAIPPNVRMSAMRTETR